MIFCIAFRFGKAPASRYGRDHAQYGNPAARVESKTTAQIPIIMKSIITLTLAVAALTLAACASKHTNTTPPPVDMGHHSGK